MNEQSAEMSLPRRALLITLSLALYALLVWTHTLSFIVQSDVGGHVTWHALQFLGIFTSAMLCGIAIGQQAQKVTRTALVALQPNQPDVRVDRMLKSAAHIVIAMGMMYAFLWISPALNRFLDAHPPLLVEGNSLLYIMGTVTGASWAILYGRRAWLGLLVSPVLSLLVISNALVTQSWP